MPEGPEVKTITDDLAKKISNKQLLNIEILGGRYKKNGNPEKFDTFVDLLPTKITDVKCKGKFIWFEAKNGWTIWNTLGMSGGWKLVPSKHSDVKFVFEDITIWFTDQRHFGTLKFSDNSLDLDRKLSSLGPDLLSDDSLTKTQFIDIINKYPSKALPKILMDQKIFSGIGNYLKSEILYASKISPLRLVNTLSDLELSNLFKNSKEIIRLSYLYKGATIRNYSDLSNNDGQFTFEFKVYNKKKDSYGYVVLKTKTNDGRTTHWVAEVQK